MDSARSIARASVPRDEAELLARARALEGRNVGELAALLGMPLVGDSRCTKGKAGEVVERALGATGGSSPVPDFPGLSVELKTIPIDLRGWPRESTFVCTLPLADADRASWATSWIRRKLARVLWLPIVTPTRSVLSERRVGRALLWAPTAEQEAVLASDFDDIVGLVGAGRVEELDARVGRWLQARPKAAHGRVRTIAYGAEDEPLSVPPRGFYLRTRFTGVILGGRSALLR